jgi:hypothetical protein
MDGHQAPQDSLATVEIELANWLRGRALNGVPQHCPSRSEGMAALGRLFVNPVEAAIAAASIGLANVLS